MNSRTGSSPPASALLSFTAENVRSYRDAVNLSLIGSRLSETGVVQHLRVSGHSSPVGVLPVAGVFGANASGKSTILRAMADMRTVVLASFRRGDQETKIPRHPFLLGNEGPGHPSRFAVELILEGVRWQYGFTIDDHEVLDEHAYYYPKGRQALVFRRSRAREPRFGPAVRSSGRLLAQLIRKNALLLSVAGAVADSFDEERSAIATLTRPLFKWFNTNLLLMDSDNRGGRIAHTVQLLQRPAMRKAILSLLQAADLGITEIERLQIDPEFAERLERALRILNGLEEESGSAQDVQFVPSDLVRLHHMGAKGPIAIDPELESQGTLVWVSFLGPVLDMLGTGATVLVDELDASLHPHLAQQFIRLFQNRETNPWCAQLIFNAHDPTLLGDSGQRSLGRDQIWLAEKNTDGATTLYSIAEFRPKRDEAVGRRYLQGRYGAVPVLDPAEFQRVADATGT